MAWCRQARSHYLNQCGPSRMMPASRPQRVGMLYYLTHYWICGQIDVTRVVPHSQKTLLQFPNPAVSLIHYQQEALWDHKPPSRLVWGARNSLIWRETVYAVVINFKSHSNEFLVDTFWLSIIGILTKIMFPKRLWFLFKEPTIHDIWWRYIFPILNWSHGWKYFIRILATLSQSI